MLDICRARLVDASQNIAFACRSTHWSYKFSTSFNRLSAGKLKNVFRCVLVSVVMLSALYAVKLPNIQRHFFVDVTAGTTPLAAWKEPVSHAQFTAIPITFVSQHSPKLSETGTTNMFGEVSVLDHSTHVQILDCQHVEPSHQIRCEFVQCVLAAVGDLGVQPCYLQPLLIPSATALDTPGKNPLQSCQPCGVTGSVSRVCNPIAVTQRSEPTDSQVNPDHASGLGERGLGWFIQTKTHEVTTGTVLDYRDRAWRARETATPFDVKLTDFGNCEAAVGRIPFESCSGIIRALLPMFGRELWVSCSFCEEIGKRSLQMSQSLLLRNAGRLTQESKFFGFSVFCPSRTAGIVIYRLASLETVRTEAQSEIVCVSDATEFTRQLPRLAVCRVTSECHS